MAKDEATYECAPSAAPEQWEAVSEQYVRMRVRGSYPDVERALDWLDRAGALRTRLGLYRTTEARDRDERLQDAVTRLQEGVEVLRGLAVELEGVLADLEDGFKGTDGYVSLTEAVEKLDAVARVDLAILNPTSFHVRL